MEMANNTTSEREKNLLKKRKEVEEQLKRVQKRSTDFGSDVDPDEETEETEAVGNKLGIIQALKDQLRDIMEEIETAYYHGRGSEAFCRRT